MWRSVGWLVATGVMTAYFEFLGRKIKRHEYWIERVEDERSRTSRLWLYFDELRLPSPHIDAIDIHHYLDGKVAGVRLATAGAENHFLANVHVHVRYTL